MKQPAEIRLATAEAIAYAATLLRSQSSVVGFPTETSYGLAANIFDPTAVARLVRIKGRPEHQPIGIIVSDRAMLCLVVETISDLAERLIQRFWPGPLTLVLPAKAGLPTEILNASGGVGVRVSPDRVASALVKAVGAPLTATSANRSGNGEARDAVSAALEGVDVVLDDGPRSVAPPSTVLDLCSAPRILRRGAIDVEQFIKSI